MHSHVYITDEDSILAEYIDAATEFAEQYQNRCLRSSTWQASYDAFPDEFLLPIPPLVSVSSIAYLDTEGASQTLSSSVYTVDAISQPARVALKYSQTWPSTYDQINAVTVTFVAGYASASLVPARTRQAIRMIAAHWFINREAVAEKSMANVPIGALELLDCDRFIEYR